MAQTLHVIVQYLILKPRTWIWSGPIPFLHDETEKQISTLKMALFKNNYLLRSLVCISNGGGNQFSQITSMYPTYRHMLWLLHIRQKSHMSNWLKSVRYFSIFVWGVTVTCRARALKMERKNCITLTIQSKSTMGLTNIFKHSGTVSPYFFISTSSTEKIKLFKWELTLPKHLSRLPP